MMETDSLVFLAFLAPMALLPAFVWAVIASLGFGEWLGRRLAVYSVWWGWWTVSGLLVAVLNVCVWVSALMATEVAGSLLAPAMLDVVVLAVLGLLGFVVTAAFSSASKHRREAQP